MRISVLGTGMVGRAHAARLTELGHEVWMGTRDVDGTLGATRPDAMGNRPMSQWLARHEAVRLVTFAESARMGEIAINCLLGAACVPVLGGLVKELEGKLIVDISNPLEFSRGTVPALTVSNTDSLAEQIQRALPTAQVVKTLNTVSATLQIDPGSLDGGDHDAFVSGDDQGAKDRVIRALKDWYGWKNVIDLGDITTARGPEMYLALWLRLWGALEASNFNIKVVRGAAE